jgi:pyroglutamyl-peptidase
MQKLATQPDALPVTSPSQANDGRTTVLLTGFGPFPRVAVNATMTLVPRLAQAARCLFPGTRFVAEILPTEWVAAPVLVDSLVARHRPDIMLHFGVSSRARGLEIETRARNNRNWAPDASGEHPRSPLVRTEGSTFVPSRLRVDAIVQRLRKHGLPAYRSWSAGGYLCNATLYHSLVEFGDRVSVVGFIHVPDGLADARAVRSSRLRSVPGSPLTWKQALAGGLEIVAALLDQPSPQPARRELALQRHL